VGKLGQKAQDYIDGDMSNDSSPKAQGEFPEMNASAVGAEDDMDLPANDSSGEDNLELRLDSEDE
jgi:hypothetical protein